LAYAVLLSRIFGIVRNSQTQGRTRGGEGMKLQKAYPVLIVVAVLMVIPWILVLMKKYMLFVFNYMGF
jgi:hypothetical protein